MNLALGLSEQLLKNHDGSHKCGPFKNTPDNENVLTLHGVIFIVNGCWSKKTSQRVPTHI